MSFLTEAAARRIATLQVPRTLATAAPRASFSTSVTMQKTIVDSTKDTLKTVDRAVSDKLVDGIDIGTTVASKVKEATENITADNAAGKAQQLKGEASGKTSELAGKAKGTAAEMAGKAEGTASQMMGKTEGTANKAAGKAKGAAEQTRKSL
ncbi:hypothetical protein B0T16DRAFT_456079 [Cercophora newfieldiana]|uniref:Uncharacterized protein n=1 Tax=Cercophora newfieldiana TaxID=92897 RepID=A0AA39Y9N8_9PEZI|nr:hypothetical protein B0T16DRAFT_456079 [Cercophora newfieldiana]